jgi:anti-sigma factor RsiW
MIDCELQHELGAYVLGGLEPDEAASVTAHLRYCAACRDHHAEIATTPALLALAANAPPRLPARVRDRVVAGTTRHRLRRRWTAIAAAAAGVAALAGGVVGWLVAPEPEARLAVALEAQDPFDVTGWAWLRAGDDALVVELELTGLEPLVEPEVYEAWLYTADERILSIGQLPADGDTLVVELTAPGSLDDYRGLWVTAEPDRRDPAHEGPTVVRARLPDDGAG